MANSIGFGKEWDYMVLKLPNNELPFEKRFENIRNCRVLKHRKKSRSVVRKQNYMMLKLRPISHLEHLLRKMQDYRTLKPALTQITF